MKTERISPPADLEREIAALIGTLHATEQRLEELTGGEVDTVAGGSGRPFLLRRAQEQLRDSEAAKQSAILNALPAHIALLDARGIIASVNEAWRQPAHANFLQGPDFEVGASYPEACDRIRGEEAADSRRAAAGVRSVLAGEKDFSMEYRCPAPAEPRWFLMMVTPLARAGARGAVVMHLNITGRKRAEHALRESQATMTAAQHIGHFGSWEIDLDAAGDEDANTLRWSDEMFRLAGYEPGAVEVTNRLFFSLVPPEEHGPIRQAVATAIREQAQYCIVHRLIRADGTTCIVQESAKIFYDDQSGRPVKIIGTAHDITERTRAEAELQRKTAMLEAQLNASSDGIVVVDPRGKKILQNRRMADLFKFPPGLAEESDDAPQLHWVTSTTRNPAEFAAQVAHLYAHPAAVSRDEVELLDGTILERYSAPVTGPDGSAYGRIWTFRDLTERRRVEQELKKAKIDAVLRESAQRYHFLADTVPLIIWTARPEGGIDYYNKAWFDFTGLSLAQTENWGWDTVVHPDDLPRCLERWTRSVATGEDYEIEYRFKRGGDGTYRWFLGRASAHRDGAGRILQWVGTGTDIDDQKRAHTELEARVAERTRELSTSNEALHAENAARQLTEAALRESNEKFHQLADNISDAFWIRSPDLREVHYVSPAFEQIWGRPVASLLANPETWIDFILAEDRERVRAAFAALTGRTAGLDIDYRIVRPDGAIRWVRVRGFPVRNAADQLIRHIGIVSDITERKQAETELRGKTAFLEAQVSSSIDGILVVDERGKKVLQNQRMTDLLKIPQHVADDHDDAPQLRWVAAATRFPAQFAEKIAFLNSHPNEISRDEMELTNGTILDRYSAPVVGPDGKYYGRIWTFRDITERRRSMEALRASEHRFKALFEQAAVGVVLVDATTARFVQVNQRFCEIVGRNHQELEQLTFADIGHPKEVDFSREKTRQMLAGEIREFSSEKRYLRKDGTEVWGHVTLSAMWDPGEKPDYFIAVVQDITERKRLDEHFLQAQKMEALGQFSGGVAHDFNNILASISGYTELSRMVLKENPEVRGHLDSVLKASGRAADLVKQILTFSRQQPQERQTIQLRPVVEESIKLLRATLPSTIAFDTEVATDAPPVLANANQIHQVLMNLGINAWHAMQDHPGRLQIKLEKWKVDATHAAVQPRLRPGTYTRVSVGDTGCGMDAATRRRIFEPFFTTKPVGQGTGLGLSVVHGIMDGHDGAVTVYSQPGEGTVFHLYFPAHAGESAAGSISEAPAPSGKGERVLVVDDEELIASMIQQTLVRLGYAAEFATDPAAALALVRANPQHFQLVLSDQTMPDMTGLVLATRLREIRPDLPVILMTGFSASLTAARLEAAGVLHVLFKPLTAQLLGSALHAALAARPSH